MYQMSRRRTKALTMERIWELLENPLDDDDDIESGDVIIARPGTSYGLCVVTLATVTTLICLAKNVENVR